MSNGDVPFIVTSQICPILEPNRLSFRRSFDDLCGPVTLTCEKLVSARRSSSLEHLAVSDSVEMTSNGRTKPATLATVLENMPLVYNSTTKRLELSKNDRDPLNNGNNSTKLIEHEDNSKGSGDSPIKSENDNLLITSQKPSPPKSKIASQFKKGHARHSSYETAQLNLLSTATGQPQSGFGRTNSLHRTTDSMSSSVSIGSLSFYSDDCSAVSIDTVPTTDSGLGDGTSSKRSSLDRRSQCSAVDWSDTSNDQSLSPGGEDIEKGPRKKVLPLPNITLPRGLFWRNKNSNTGVPWNKLFGGGNHSKTTNTSETAAISTTGLILEDRPSNLPAKSEAEITKHRQQYQEIMEAVRKKDQKDAKEKRKADVLRKKQEDQISSASHFWSNEILPRWNEMSHSKKCHELWWKGLPPGVRGKVWNLAIGNDLNITKDLYEICLARAMEKLSEQQEKPDEQDFEFSATCSSPIHNHNGCNIRNGSPECSSPIVVNREGTMELIHLDVARTFPNLRLFQRGGPYYDLLLNLLSAYVCYRPDVGYVQSMSLVAAVLLLNLDPADAFIAFANLLNQPLQLVFYRLLQPQMTHYFIAYDQYLARNLPKLHSHFDTLDVRPDLYLIEWLYTIYAKSLPLDVTCRIWDIYLRDGEEFLFKTALGILRTFESNLLEMDFDSCVQFLTNLPETLTADDLFHNIEPFMRCIHTEKSFSVILNEVTANVSGRLGGSPNPKMHRRKPSDTSLTSAGSQMSGNLKMSKSLSGLLGDWLAPNDNTVS